MYIFREINKMNPIRITSDSVEIRHLEVIPASESWDNVENTRFSKGDVWYVNATQDCDAVSQANAILAHETGTALVGESPKKVYKYTKNFGGDTQEELFGAVAEYHVAYPSVFYITAKKGGAFKSESAAKAATTRLVNAGKLEYGIAKVIGVQGGYVAAISPSERDDVKIADKENHIRHQEELAAEEERKYIAASAATLDLSDLFFESPTASVTLEEIVTELLYNSSVQRIYSKNMAKLLDNTGLSIDQLRDGKHTNPLLSKVQRFLNGNATQDDFEKKTLDACDIPTVPTKYSSSNIIPLVAPATYGHTQLELFQSKTGIIEPEKKPKITNTFHAAVAAHASIEIGLDATPVNITKTFGDIEVETGTIYQIGDSILSPILVGDHNPHWENGVPNFELAEAQINMSITGTKLCYLAVARGYDNLEIIQITWDDSGVEYIEQLKAFNADYVLRGVQPHLSGNTRVDAIDTSRYQQNDKVVECSTAAELAQQHEEAAENYKAANAKLKSVKNEIFHALEGASALVSTSGDTVINIEVNKRGARRIVTNVHKEKFGGGIIKVDRIKIEEKARRALNNLDALMDYSIARTVVINLSDRDDIEYFKLRFRGSRYVSWDDIQSPGGIELVRFITDGKKNGS